MDKIYSRRKIKVFYSGEKKTKKKIAILIIIIIAVVTAGSIFKSINPVFENLCKDKAMEISTRILNEESTDVLRNNDYNDIVTITKTDENNVLKIDVSVINKIASDIAVKVTNRLKNLQKDNILIPIGTITGNKYLSGIGPGINITIIPSRKCNN